MMIEAIRMSLQANPISFVEPRLETLMEAVSNQNGIIDVIPVDQENVLILLPINDASVDEASCVVNAGSKVNIESSGDSNNLKSYDKSIETRLSVDANNEIAIESEIAPHKSISIVNEPQFIKETSIQEILTKVSKP